jgi:hypothetical protein
MRLKVLRGKPMTKTQQGLARQATIFINCGGKALTALLRMLLLSVAVFFEAVGRVFASVEKVVGSELTQMERGRKRAQVLDVTYKAVASRAELARVENTVPTTGPLKWRYGWGFGRK